MSTTFAQLRDALHSRGSTEEVEFAVTKANEEQRYTFGVMYVPNAADADDEYATLEDLEKASWDYFRSGKRDIRDTHTERVIGELVALAPWPFEHEANMSLGDGTVHKYKLPAGTVWAGVIWQPEAWELVKSGKLRGYSMGGKAVRMKEAGEVKIPRMRDLGVVEDATAKADGPKVPLTNKPGKSNWVEEAGGLPDYIRRIAEHLKGKGMSDSHAIATAVNTVRKWCDGGDNVKADTQAKACAALAEWEKMKATKSLLTEDEQALVDATLIQLLSERIQED